MGEDKRMILLLHVFLLLVLASPSSSACHPRQRDALLSFINSFSITPSPPIGVYDFCGNASYAKTASWREDQDCCSWDGVSCDNSTSDIVGLHLACARLRGHIYSSSPLFSLHHLRDLSLQGNDFHGSTVPPEISMFAQLTCLNLSYSNISGILPTELSQLSKLSSLDLSDNGGLEMQDQTMRMLIQNLTQMEELNLGYVNMSTVSPTSFMNFSSSLISLELSYCSLGGKFPEFIFGLPNIQMIDLSGNYDLTGTLPKSKWSPKLDYLSLSGCSFMGAVPNSIGNLSRLTLLDLSGNNFNGDFYLGMLSTLENFQFLYLSGVFVWGEDANHNFSLPKLQELYMENCNLSKFPSFLSRSKELRFLGLWGNKIQEIPTWLFGIDTLEELDLHNNIIKGSIPRSICQQASLSIIYLDGNKLTGVIPQCLDNLMDLVNLDLRDNSLSGTLPPSLAKCTSLISLDVSYNGIKGSIPQSICQLASLSFIDLGGNKLTGVIPQCLGNLTDLQYLYLRNNSLSGALPPSLANCRSLKSLDAGYNSIKGSIPPSICHLAYLSSIYLVGNKLTGVIPQCLGNLTNLHELYLSNNSLGGPLPPTLANCTSLVILDVSYNSINGAPPTPWLSTSSINILHLEANNFVGRWPSDIFLQSVSLYDIDLSDNKLEGPLPLPSYATVSYLASNNHFSGDLSSLSCNATNLRFLDLSNNSLTGTLPVCLKNVTTGLVFLNLRLNKLRGQIPEIFYEGSNLMSFDVSRNQFEGQLPRSLSHCKNLVALDVGRNKITDSFPNWLGDLPLKVISLRSNNFHGNVSKSVGTQTFSELRILDLSNNRFEGNISNEFIGEMLGMSQDNNYKFPGSYLDSNNGTGVYFSVMIDLKGTETEMVKINVQFAVLDLSSNRFQGEIPKSIGFLKSLKGLNLSHNGFTGMIPPSIGNLTNLEGLDLSSNHLFGEIPKELGKLTYLGALDLSSNNLTGPIPLGGHFNTFSNSSFEGNLGLCGIPLTRSCGQGHKEAQPPQEGKDNGEEEEGGGWLEWKYVAMGFGSGMGMGISLGYMVLEMGRPLWLVRMVIRLEASYRKMSKRKGAPRRRNGGK